MTRMVDTWGRVKFHGDDLVELLMRGYQIDDLLIIHDATVTEYNRCCRQHNKAASMIQPPDIPKLTPRADAAKRQQQWWMPNVYRSLDVRAVLLARCQRQDQIDRVMMEMDLFEAKGFLPMLRLMCFLVARWRETGVVWGVGRGSSVASYCLFLIGVHRIDSLRYQLDITEFLR
jgi:DNA polymerase III alpha subunit